MLAEGDRESRGAREGTGGPASFTHTPQYRGSWGQPCTGTLSASLPLMTRSCRGAQALGKSHCWPVFRREAGIPCW